jgi:predicted DNA binding CopG/RHH family protein
MAVKLDREERELLKSFGRSEWRPVKNLERESRRYRKAAAATVRKDQRVNLRISKPDLDAIRLRAAEEGLPYQTLIASVLHKYASGRLREG